MTTLLQRAMEFEQDLVDLRRDLHRHPELSFRETRTAAELARRVAGLGYSVRTGVGRTGVLAELANGAGPTIALRADMDALPISEANDVDYRSTVDGAMHACGHDSHMAMMTGAARLLADARERGELPAGTIRLLFQPSEEASDDENKSGATRMIEDGAMQNVSAIFGLHIGAHMSAGKAFVRAGPYMAGADHFTCTVHGRSSHAARPHEGVDAIVLAAHAVLACQSAFARRLAPDDQGVLTIGTIRGGVAENVLADAVVFQGTIRYFEERVREVLHRELRAAMAVVDAMGGRGEARIQPGYPPVVNDERATDIAGAAIAEALGADAIAPYAPLMTAEDFGILAREAPGCFFWLGGALDPPREHHHPRFDIDERVLVRGASALASCALHGLRSFGD